MIFIGIDVASNKHDCFIANQNGEVLAESFSFPNSLTGYKKLQHTIERVMESSVDSNVRIGLESTGLYHLNLLNFLTVQGFQVQEINPILTSMTSKSSSLRKTKTDAIDAKAICMFLFRNQSNFKPHTLKVYNNEALKSLSRYRFSLVKELGQAKVKLYTMVARTFPELLGFFSNLYIKTPLQLLHRYPLPADIAKTRIDVLTNFLLKASHGRVKLDKAMKLKDIAKASIGDSSQFYSIQIRSVIELIWHLQSQVEGINTEIHAMIDEHFAFVLTMPGVSYTTAAHIVGEIGDPHRFKSFDSLLAYAGLDPVVYQSGNYNASNTRPSKRGSSYLRWALHQVSARIVNLDHTFSTYYEKKRLTENKHYYVALGHVGKKLLRVLYTMLKYRQTFVPQSV